MEWTGDGRTGGAAAAAPSAQSVAAAGDACSCSADVEFNCINQQVL